MNKLYIEKISISKIKNTNFLKIKHFIVEKKFIFQIFIFFSINLTKKEIKHD